MLASRREQNLKELLTRADPYSIKVDLTGDFTGMGYKRCRQGCDSCVSFVMETDRITSSATGKTFLIRRCFSCNAKNVIYCAMCTKCLKQGVGSTADWKPRMRNYKSHINNGHKTCGIVKHFLEDCIDEDDPCGHLIFFIIDGLNNTDNLNSEQIDDLLLQKEKFWIGALLTQHSGMNTSHDWNRTRRNDRNPSFCN